LTLKPRILPITQRTIIDIPDTTKRLVQVFLLIWRWEKSVTIGSIDHLQNIDNSVNLVKQQLSQKEAVLADGPLSLPGMMIFHFLIRYGSKGFIPDYLVENHNAGVSRGKS